MTSLSARREANLIASLAGPVAVAGPWLGLELGHSVACSRGGRAIIEHRRVQRCSRRRKMTSPAAGAGGAARSSDRAVIKATTMRLQRAGWARGGPGVGAECS